jgi:hypothetical protein
MWDLYHSVVHACNVSGIPRGWCEVCAYLANFYDAPSCVCDPWLLVDWQQPERLDEVKTGLWDINLQHLVENFRASVVCSSVRTEGSFIRCSVVSSSLSTEGSFFRASVVSSSVSSKGTFFRGSVISSSVSSKGTFFRGSVVSSSVNTEGTFFRASVVSSSVNTEGSFFRASVVSSSVSTEGSLFRGRGWPKQEADLPPPSSIEVKNIWYFSFLPHMCLHCFVLWVLSWAYFCLFAPSVLILVTGTKLWYGFVRKGPFFRISHEFQFQKWCMLCSTLVTKYTCTLTGKNRSLPEIPCFLFSQFSLFYSCSPISVSRKRTRNCFLGLWHLAVWYVAVKTTKYRFITGTREARVR